MVACSSPKTILPPGNEKVGYTESFSQTLPYSSRGIYFYPLSMRYKPKLINFDDSLIKTVYRKVKDSPEFVETTTPSSQPSPPLRPVEPIIQPPTTLIDENTKTLWLRKTEQPDIYDMYENDNSQHKIGIAYVQSLATSKMLRTIFKNLNVATSVAFICKFDKTFGKWSPVCQK